MTEAEMKQKIEDQEIYIIGLKYEIEKLQHKLDNFESYQREKCCECEKKAIVDYADSEFQMMQLKEKIRAIVKD